LQSILKVGLTPNIKRKLFSEEDGSLGRPSNKSWGGIYLTPDPAYVYDYLEDQGEGPGCVIVAVEIGAKSLILDEDRLPPISKIYSDVLGSEILAHVVEDWLALRKGNKTLDSKWANMVLTDIRERVSSFYDAYPDESYEKAVRGVMDSVSKQLPSLWAAAILRAMSYVWEGFANYPKNDEQKKLSDEIKRFVIHEGKPFAKDLTQSKAEAEQQYRNTVSKLTRTLKFDARRDILPNGTYRGSARTMDPITFSGANKIVGVSVCEFDPESKEVTLSNRYGTPLSESLSREILAKVERRTRWS